MFFKIYLNILIDKTTLLWHGETLLAVKRSLVISELLRNIRSKQKLLLHFQKIIVMLHGYLSLCNFNLCHMLRKSSPITKLEFSFYETKKVGALNREKIVVKSDCIFDK